MSAEQPTPSTSDLPDHTCYFDGSDGCPACAMEPAGVLSRAIEALATENPDTALIDLLQHLADEMSDEHCIEKEFPEHIPSARWEVAAWYGNDPTRDYWTAALGVAREILGEPDPNKVKAGEQA